MRLEQNYRSAARAPISCIHFGQMLAGHSILRPLQLGERKSIASAALSQLHGAYFDKNRMPSSKPCRVSGYI